MGVCVDDMHPLDEVLVAGVHRPQPLAAAALGAVLGERDALDVAAV